MSQTSNPESSDVIEELQDLQEEVIEDIEETDDAGGGTDDSEPQAPETEPEPEPEPEVQQPQVDPEVVAQWLKSQGYKVDKEEVEQAEEEIPDPMLDPQAYAEYVREKTLEATAPLLKPMLVDQAIIGIKSSLGELGIDLPEAVIETMKQDASAAKLSELQSLVGDPVRLLATGAYYYKQANLKPAKAAPTKPVQTPSEVPVGQAQKPSITIPKDQLEAYRDFLYAFGLKDTAEERRKWLS